MQSAKLRAASVTEMVVSFIKSDYQILHTDPNSFCGLGMGNQHNDEEEFAQGDVWNRRSKD